MTSGETVEDDIGGVDALAKCLGAGGIDRLDPVSRQHGQYFHHLTIAPIGNSEQQWRAQWWVMRSGSAVVIFASPNTEGHSPKAGFVVTMIEVRS